MLGRLVTQWADIVGPELAAKTQPVKTRYMKAGKNGKPVISLDIAVTPAEATLLLYRKDLILARINQIFGDDWVSAIRFVPIAANTPAPRPRKTIKPLTPTEKTYLSGVLETVGDADLQASLQALGLAILQDRPS